MECAYKAVLGNRSVEEFCDYYGNEFLKFVDASLAVRMHEIFGYGKSKRLPELFDDMNPRLNAQMRAMVESEDEDLWVTARETHWWTGRKIKHATGWNPCDVVKEMPIRDDWHPQAYTRKELRQHDIRKEYLDTMEVKLGLYWHTVLDYLIVEKGFGAERLDRLYRAVRQDYITFAGEFLKGTKASEKTMARMIKDMQDKAKAIGVGFDYGNGGKLKTEEK